MFMKARKSRAREAAGNYEIDRSMGDQRQPEIIATHDTPPPYRDIAKRGDTGGESYPSRNIYELLESHPAPRREEFSRLEVIDS